MEWIKSILADQLAFSVIWAVAIVGVILITVAYCIYGERKIAAWIQDRYGPNRVGPRGLLQPIADGLKFFLKEEFIPPWADRVLFTLAPIFLFFLSLLGFAIIPWAGAFRWPWMPPGQTISTQVASIDIGILYMLALGGMAVYGIVLGGWASNSKFPFYGAMRGTAQMLSYEIPLGMALLVMVLASGSVRLETMLDPQTRMWQAGGVPVWPAWNLFLHPVTFLLTLTCVFAETNRLPFDLAEAEQELVGGYHTEYSALKFGAFYLAEYANMITISGILSVVFLGGWHLPGLSGASTLAPPGVGLMLLRFVVIWAKIIAFLFFFMWVRWTLPRFRYDQLMAIAWKGLVPLALGVLVWTVVLVLFGRQGTWLAPAGEIGVLVLYIAVLGAWPAKVTGRQPDLAQA